MDSISIWVWVVLIVIVFIGTSIAGGASLQFWDTVNKKDGIVSSVNLTAADFAKDALTKKNLPVNVVKTSGKFNDYYSHKAHHVAISEDLYSSNTVVALGVTAHELGHAITDYNNSFVYRLHYSLRRFIKVINWLVYLVLIAAIVLLFFEEYSFISIYLFYTALGMFVASILFKLLTVKNEKNATDEGLDLLRGYGMPKSEIRTVKKVLNAALLTYIGEIFMPFVKILKAIAWVFDNTLGRLFR